jgi:organic radical activating enzyme
VQRQGHELKLVWPQAGIDIAECEAANFTHHYLQPMDNAQRVGNFAHGVNTQTCIAHCLQHPTWRLSLQTHKITGIR